MDGEKLLFEIDEALEDMKLAEEKLNYSDEEFVDDAQRRYQFACERYQSLLRKAKKTHVKWNSNKLYMKLIQHI
jgi:hypothetical protein